MFYVLLLVLVAVAAYLAHAATRLRRAVARDRQTSSTLDRVTGSRDEERVTLYVGRVTARAGAERELAGPLIRWGQYGKTNAGRLRVAAGGIRVPDPITNVKLTREHDRGESRGHAIAIDAVDNGLDARVRPADGPAGDDAIREAADHTRDGFSVDLENVRLVGDWIVDSELVAIGQVGIPAFTGMGVDRVAASRTPTHGRNTMNETQRARLAALRALETLTQAEALELAELAGLETAETDAAAAETEAAAAAEAAGNAPAAPAAPARVAASMPATPAGAQRPATRTRAQGGALGDFVRRITGLYRPGSSRDLTTVQAALSDVTWSDHADNVAAPAWSGELWSGVAYEPEFTPLLNSGTLTNWEGRGWRWVTKPVMADYAGDKAAIPSADIATEPSTYEAARMAVGHDFDRKFYDFPDEAFLASYLEAVRESWAVKLDAKVEAYLIAQAVAQTTIDGDGSTLKAVGRGLRRLKRLRVGRGTFVILNDDDFDDLMDVTNLDLPAYLDMWGVDPRMFTSSANVSAGSVLVGAKAAGTVRTLPGSPIRATAQHLANGGIDEAFFGYWAIEEHHTSGIISVPITGA